jgi:putative SOS response-associated peptidase YedK
MYILAILVGLLALAGSAILRTQFKEKLVPNVVMGVGTLFVVLGLFNGVMFYAEPGYQYHVRTIFGQEKHINDLGYKTRWFGKVTPWKKAMTVQAVGCQEIKEGDRTDFAETSGSLPPYGVTFLDNVSGHVCATARFRVPADEATFLRLVSEYRTPENFLNTSVIPAFQQTINASTSLLGAEEYYSGGRTEFNFAFEDQLKGGIYSVRREESRIATNVKAKGTSIVQNGKEQTDFGDEDKTVFKVTKILDANGHPLRKQQGFSEFGVVVVEGMITDFIANEQFQKRMEAKQAASASRAIAKESRMQEEEQRLLVIARGKREVAETQYKAQLDQAKKTTDAETTKQLALIDAQKALEQARIDKLAEIEKLAAARTAALRVKTTADATAYEKRAVLLADGALEKKLEAQKEIQKYWADAYSKRNVPSMIFGGSGNGTGSDTDASTFMNLLTVKTAKDLALDMTVSQGAKVAK